MVVGIPFRVGTRKLEILERASFGHVILGFGLGQQIDNNMRTDGRDRGQQ